MRNLNVAIVMAVALALVGGTAAYAEPGKAKSFDKGTMMEKHAGEMDKKLGLSDEQKQKMKAFREEHKAKMQALREKMMSARKELRTVLDAQTLDRGKAQSLTNEIKSTFGQIADLRLEMLFKAHEVFTPEQLKKMKGFREKHKGEMKKRWNKEGGAREKFKKRHSGGGEGFGDDDGDEGPGSEDGPEEM